MGKAVVVVTWLDPNQNISLYPKILNNFKIGKRLCKPSTEYFFLDTESEAQSLKNHLEKNIPVRAYRLVGDPGNQTVLDSAGNPVVVREPSIDIIEDEPRRSTTRIDMDDYETHIQLRNQAPEWQAVRLGQKALVIEQLQLVRPSIRSRTHYQPLAFPGYPRWRGEYVQIRDELETLACIHFGLQGTVQCRNDGRDCYIFFGEKVLNILSIALFNVLMFLSELSARVSRAVPRHAICLVDRSTTRVPCFST